MLRCVSIWQPYASLLVRGFKLNETRPHSCPKHMIGTRIGIASTKQIKPEQRALFEDEVFQKYYRETGLPALDNLQHGFLLGTVFVNSSDIIEEDDLDDVTEEEQIYGDWRPGRYAWRCRDPQLFPEPIKVSGKQGIWFHDDGAKVLPFSPAS